MLRMEKEKITIYDDDTTYLTLEITSMQAGEGVYRFYPEPEDELKHELNVMHKVNACDGESINAKIDKYFECVDSKAKVCELKNNGGLYMGRYKIKHK